MRHAGADVATAGMLRQSEKESASVHEGKIYNWATGELLGTTGPFYDKVRSIGMSAVGSEEAPCPHGEYL